MPIVRRRYVHLRFAHECVSVRHELHSFCKFVTGRATIGCFRASLQSLRPLSKTINLFSILFQVFKLHFFCWCFIVISIFILPLALITQFLIVHSLIPQLCFLPLFARMHYLVRTAIYVTSELFKRVPPGIISHLRYKRLTVMHCLFWYTYFYTGCVTLYNLYTQLLVFRTILLSGDVEINPGPETLNFCTWNLNSITAYDFLRVSLIEAYNSVYKYDLIGIVETHLDSTIDNDRLALEGYSFLKSNHPQDVKRGGVGLYVKDSLPTTERPDLVTLPECVVCEFQSNMKKYFLS